MTDQAASTVAHEFTIARIAHRLASTFARHEGQFAETIEKIYFTFPMFNT